MTEPLAVAVMLTKDRPQMAARAAAAFQAQTYGRKYLLTFDTSKRDESIGVLRNMANEQAAKVGADVLIHWDDDDVSHPNRIAEQVAHLQSSKASIVGYNQLLFWRSTKAAGEAWIYRDVRSTYALGTSLCYWLETWAERPFRDLGRTSGGTGEDTDFIKGRNVCAVPGFGAQDKTAVIQSAERLGDTFTPLPRLIASIHGGNTMPYDLEDMMAHGSTEWKRAPEWDSYARKVMEL